MNWHIFGDDGPVHQRLCVSMMTSSNGKHFRVTGSLWIPHTGEFPTQRSMTQSFDVSLICTLNKRLSKQSWGWWFETPSRPLWWHTQFSLLLPEWISKISFTVRISAVLEAALVLSFVITFLLEFMSTISNMWICRPPKLFVNVSGWTTISNTFYDPLGFIANLCHRQLARLSL